VHIASDSIAAHSPDLGPGLLGDKSHSVVFDNTKIKTLVPWYRAEIPFAAGAREIVRWHDEHPGIKHVDPAFMELSDQLVQWGRRPL
jgi:hypothetical protein